MLHIINQSSNISEVKLGHISLDYGMIKVYWHNTWLSKELQNLNIISKMELMSNFCYTFTATYIYDIKIEKRSSNLLYIRNLNIS